jgi:DHA2 family multidrug resistance protein
VPDADVTPRSLAGSHNPWLVAVVVSLATFMEVLDLSIANVSLRNIAGTLSVSVDESTWVLTSYLVANAIILPISGWLASVIGRKRYYLACVMGFTLASLCCGIAPSLGFLIAFRVLQGLAGGGLAPSSLSMLRDSFPERRAGMVFALYGVVTVAAPALGPILGGYLTDNYSWHWVFLINVPVGALAFVASFLLLEEPAIETRERRARVENGLRVDYFGFVCVVVGLGSLQIVLDEGEKENWFASPLIVATAILAAAGVVALVVRELSVANPVVELSLLKNRNFLAATVLMFGTFLVLLSTTQLIPQLAQIEFGYTAMLAGLVITPGALLVVMMLPIVGFLVGHVQARILIGIGLGTLALSLFHMAGFTPDMSFSHMVGARCFQAAGVALLFVPITSIAYLGIPENKSGEASALINLARNVGGSVGIALAQTLLAHRADLHQMRMASHLTTSSPAFRAALARATARFTELGSGPVLARRRAAGAIYRAVTRQATMLAYDDVFYAMGVGALLTLGLVLLLRANRPAAHAPRGGH